MNGAAPTGDAPAVRSLFAHDAAFWRKLARFGAARGPEWWVRYSPSFFGLAAALAVPRARRAVQANLRRVRGKRGSIREALDIAHTFQLLRGVSRRGAVERLEEPSPPHRGPAW